MSDLSTVNWGQLVQALKDGQAVLILGPGVEEITMPDGGVCLLQTLLANYLAKKITERLPQLSLTNKDNLSYVCQHFEDSHGKQANSLLGNEVEAFYQLYEREVPPIYRQIANARFHCIINTNPNKLIVTGFEAEDYLFAQDNFAYYHYFNPTHNQKTEIDSDNITESTPLIYNLFGVSDEPSSLVLTETQQLQFIDTILQTDKDTIPPSVAIQFMSRRDSPISKRLIFVGFDFNDWRLRIILHIINRYQTQGALKSYAHQNLNNLDKLTQFFYQRNFNVDFIQSDASNFLRELSQQYDRITALPPPEEPQLRLFIMYHEADADICTDLEEHLALLKRNKLVEVWHTGKIIAGAEIDFEIKKQINTANVILLLVSADFLASDYLYDDLLKAALERQKAGQAFVIPIIARACPWEMATFKDLKMILPSPRGKKPLYAANNQNPEVSFTQLAKEIATICQKILDRLRNSLSTSHS